jgi:hypothetical protein
MTEDPRPTELLYQPGRNWGAVFLVVSQLLAGCLIGSVLAEERVSGLTRGLAIAGAVVLTVGFAWGMVSNRRDSRRIKANLDHLLAQWDDGPRRDR